MFTADEPRAQLTGTPRSPHDLAPARANPRGGRTRSPGPSHIAGTRVSAGTAATDRVGSFRGGGTMARARGIGGVFFKADDPERLIAWYRETLEITVDGPSSHTGSWGVSFEISDLPDDLYLRFAVAPPDTVHFDGGFMVNFVVDGLDEILTRVRDTGGTVLGERDLSEVGRFAWIVDPDKNRVELWEPAPCPNRH